MRELVGRCKACGREVFCNDGFFTGIVLEDKSVICFECEEKEQQDATGQGEGQGEGEGEGEGEG